MSMSNNEAESKFDPQPVTPATSDNDSQPNSEPQPVAPDMSNNEAEFNSKPQPVTPATSNNESGSNYSEPQPVTLATSNNEAELSKSEPHPVTPLLMEGDILDAILSRLPLIHLVPASFVSNSWSHAAYFSYFLCPQPKPWLFIYRQRFVSPYLTAAYAYDPSTNAWITINQPTIIDYDSINSSNSNFMYMLSHRTFSFSFDPFHLTWHHATLPNVSSTGATVALVGHYIVVAGGACAFEYDRPGPVIEIYDIRTCKWTPCKPMPGYTLPPGHGLYHSTAVNGNKLYLTDMESSQGVTYVLDVETQTWFGPYNLLPDPIILSCVIAFINGRLILIALVADAEDGYSTGKLWEVNTETFECRSVGEMPDNLVDKLKWRDLPTSTIEIRSAGNFAYLYDPTPSAVRWVVTCEFIDGDGGGCRWGKVKNMVRSKSNFREWFALGCVEVGIKDLREAMVSGNCSFKVKL